MIETAIVLLSIAAGMATLAYLAALHVSNSIARECDDGHEKD